MALSKHPHLIDVHAHYALPLTNSEIEEVKLTMRAEHFVADLSEPWTMDHALSFMDRNGIEFQMLSYPSNFAAKAARQVNEFGAKVVDQHPDRFGLLASLPLSSPDAAVREVAYASEMLNAAGFVLVTNYDGVYFGDSKLDPIWESLNEISATILVHPISPAGFSLLSCGRPGPVIEFPLDTARTVVDALYAKVFKRYPKIKFILSHAGGVLTTLASRLVTTGILPWVPNPNGVTAEDIKEQLRGLYYDTALACSPHSMLPLLETASKSNIVYGSDFPQGDVSVIESNLDYLHSGGLFSESDVSNFAVTARRLFPELLSKKAVK